MTTQPLSEFSVPRSTLEATLLLAHGETLGGVIFLIPRTPLHTGRETPLDMLNRGEPVFPFRTDEDGQVLLITKAQTMRLSAAAGDTSGDPEGQGPARHVRVEVALADGSSVTGTVTMELPAARSRVLDYLNEVPDPFFAVSDGGTIHYVNHNHVLYVRPTEE